ncbi:MAG: substrate-binding domain-containing protein [Nocardiopsaceae bacterium]|nr:substrate-binding domain-containing protein [Nocardiopsaceae bacterium]
MISALHHPDLDPALVGVIAAVAAIWLATALFGRRRITWREHMDAPVGLLPRQARRGEGWAEGLVLTRQREEVENPSLVLLRVRNSGFAAVREADIRRPITFTFPGRQVKEFTVTDCRRVTRAMIQPPGGRDASIVDNRIYLPRFPMKRRASFKLLVLLSGADGEVLGKGRLRRGAVVRESLRRGPLARNIAFGAALAMLVGAQTGIVLTRSPGIPASCVAGRLTLEGSTAFAPAAQRIGQADAKTCPGTSVSTSAIATFTGLHAVNAAAPGPDPAHGAAGLTPGTASQIAMSDGPAPKGYPALVGHPVAVIIFGVVVNKDTNVYNLTTQQIRGIFAGTITNWRQVGGANLPVRIVARTPGSGTRANFDAEILGGRAEPPFSSYNCTAKDADPKAPVTKCEIADTGTLLQRVSSVPGAIGYAQISDAAPFGSVETVNLDGTAPKISAVQRGGYPYWTVEYLYTHGTPAPGSLAAQFLAFMHTAVAGDILRTQGYIPCADPNQPLPVSLCHR